MKRSLSYKSYNLVYRCFRSHWKKLALASLFSVLLAFTSCFLAYLVGPSISIILQPKQEAYLISDLVGPNISWLVDYFFSIKTINALNLSNILVFYIVVISLIKAFSTIAQSLLWEATGELIAWDLKNQFFKGYITSHPYSKELFGKEGFDKNISTLITTDIKIFRDYLVNFWGGFPREFLQIFALSFSLLLLSPILFFSFIFCIVPVAYILKKIGKKLKRRSQEALEGYSLLSEWLQERFLGIETIKARRTEAYEINKMVDFNSKLFDKYYKLAYTQSRTSPLLEIVAACALISVIFVALRLIQHGNLTASVAISFFASVAVLSQSINKLGRYFNRNRAADAAKDRILKYLHLCEQEKKKKYRNHLVVKDSEKISVLCQNLSFGYQRHSSIILKDFNFCFLKNKFYCIAGPSGCGKSSLLKCILGLLPYKIGEIKYASNIIPLKNIAYVPQKVTLPPLSIAECISYPLSGVDKGRLESSLDKVGLSSCIKNLADGVNTVLGDEVDTGLSGGQNQRILLARIFYHDFPLIVIDEGTSSLDPHSEKKVCYNLRKLIEEKFCTIIFVSHRQEAMRFADDVVYIR